MEAFGSRFARRAFQIVTAATFICANAPPPPDLYAPTDACLEKKGGDVCSYTRFERTVGLSCYGTYEPAGRVLGTCVECPPDSGCRGRLVCESKKAGLEGGG